MLSPSAHRRFGWLLLVVYSALMGVGSSWHHHGAEGCCDSGAAAAEGRVEPGCPHDCGLSHGGAARLAAAPACPPDDCSSEADDCVVCHFYAASQAPLAALQAASAAEPVWSGGEDAQCAPLRHASLYLARGPPARV